MRIHMDLHEVTGMKLSGIKHDVLTNGKPYVSRTIESDGQWITLYGDVPDDLTFQCERENEKLKAENEELKRRLHSLGAPTYR